MAGVKTNYSNYSGI